MLGEAFSAQSNGNGSVSGKENPKRKSPNKNKKKKKRGGRKTKMTAEQLHAFNSINEWVFLDQPSTAVDDDFAVHNCQSRGGDKIVFDLHSHSIRSDGFLSPSKLVERAHGNGVSGSVFLLPLWNGFCSLFMEDMFFFVSLFVFRQIFVAVWVGVGFCFDICFRLYFWVLDFKTYLLFFGSVICRCCFTLLLNSMVVNLIWSFMIFQYLASSWQICFWHISHFMNCIVYKN